MGKHDWIEFSVEPMCICRCLIFDAVMFAGFSVSSGPSYSALVTYHLVDVGRR